MFGSMGLRRAPVAQVVEDVSNVSGQEDLVSALDGALNLIVRGKPCDCSTLPPLLAPSLKRLQDEMERRNVADLKDAVGYSSMASETTAAISRAVLSTKEIDGLTQSISAAIVQLDASMNGIATLGNNSLDAMQTGKSLMAEGAGAAEGAAKSMDDIAAAMGTIDSSVRALEQAVNQIGDIVGSIEAIASQTNLLALNATIEAARAGESGAGCVVAGEVKALSGQTAKATEDIRRRIDHLRANVGSLVQSTHLAETSVANGREVNASARQKIQSIDVVFNEALHQIGEISHILGEQAGATRELAQTSSKIASHVAEAHNHANLAMRTVVNCDALTEQQFKALDERAIPDYVLYRAKSDHMLWKKKLNQLFAGVSSLSASELSDHHSCRLGKWYASVADASIKSHPAFLALEAPHRAVHQFGKASAEAIANGDRAEGYRLLSEMEKASVEVVRLIDTLIARK